MARYTQQALDRIWNELIRTGLLPIGWSALVIDRQGHSVPLPPGETRTAIANLAREHLLLPSDDDCHYERILPDGEWTCVHGLGAGRSP